MNENDSRKLVERPAHVSEELVVPFDLYSVPGATHDIVRGYLGYLGGPPIFWTPFNGGHWVVTTAEDIDTVASDAERFSTRRIAIPKTREEDPPLLPLESEGARHADLRRPLFRALLPKAIIAKEDKVRELAAGMIAALKPRGACEFVGEFAHRLPVEIFFSMAGLPLEDSEAIREIAGKAVRSSDAEERAHHQGLIYAYLADEVVARRRVRGTDLFSSMFDSEAARSLSDREAITFAMFVLFAGVDTTATVLAMVARALALDEGLRADLADNLHDKTFLRNAVEEFIRCFHVSSSTREIAADMRFKEVEMRKGEMVQTLPIVYGYDSSRYDQPFLINPRRKFPIVHAAFGKGAHMCPGAHLARSEIRIFLEEWLAAIPHFQLAPDKPPTYATGVVNAAVSLHLQW